MKALVTGGAGFIGSHLVDKLATEYEVVVIDNLSTGSVSNLDKSRRHITFVGGDIREMTLVRDVMNKVDLVFHLAANVQIMKSIDDPLTDLDINARGTLSLLMACKNVKRFVYCSSTAVYGEPTYLPIDENHPLNPESPYAISKLAGEKYVVAFSRTRELPATCLRLFNVYGTRQVRSEYSSVIPTFMGNARSGLPLTIFGDGEQTRDFVNVYDVVRALMTAATHPQAIGETFNIATGKSTSINELARLVQEINRKKSIVVHKKPRHGEIKHSQANVNKAKRVLGFVANIGLEEGLRLSNEDFERDYRL